jgi:hypothetical protein
MPGGWGDEVGILHRVSYHAFAVDGHSGGGYTFAPTDISWFAVFSFDPSGYVSDQYYNNTILHRRCQSKQRLLAS